MGRKRYWIAQFLSNIVPPPTPDDQHIGNVLMLDYGETSALAAMK